MKRIVFVVLLVLSGLILGDLLVSHSIEAQQFANNRYLYISTATTTSVKRSRVFCTASRSTVERQEL
ncbi:MAG: hypothetical protein WBC04_21025 [Candidatus Acidiferrales bacterium]